MENIVLAIIVLGGCFLMHFFMMRKGHSSQTDTENKKNQNTASEKQAEEHSNHKHGGCCH